MPRPSRTSRSRWLTAALVAVLAVPATAGVAVAAPFTGSQITTPGADSRPRYDADLGPADPANALVVRGTAAGGEDPGELRCTWRDAAGTLQSVTLDPGPVAVDGGSFAATASLEPAAGLPCRLRLVPQGAALADEQEAAPFTGPRLLAGLQATTRIAGPGNPNAGRIEDFAVRAAGRAGAARWAAAAAAGAPVALEPIGADGPLRARSPFAGNAVLDRSGTLAGDTRSGLVVDGRSTFGPSPLAAFDPALDGLDGVQIVALSTDPQTGTTTSVTREPFLVCPADVAFADLSPATCPQVRDAGVQLERTVATGADGATLTASDRFVSTDGLAHAVTVRYSHRQAAGPNAYRVPWEPDPSFRARTSGELLPTPPARVSSIELRAEASDSVPGPQNPLGAVTLVPRPDQLRFTGGASFEVTYARRVPASGALQVVQRFAAATGAAELAALVSAHEAAARASAPRVEITSPTLASGFDNAYVLTGRAEGLGAITALDVNGRTVVPAADGAFSVPLELRTGPNPVSVTAVDAAGDRTEAAATISFTPPPASASYTRPTYRRGVILLPVTCRALTGTSCVIRTALSARFKRKIGRRARFKSVTLQRRTVAVPAGSSTVVRLRVSARNRALVRKYRRLRARLELVQAGVTSASGKPARRLYGVTLK